MTATQTWTDVYRSERDRLVRLAYLITGSRAAAEDLVQETFLRVMPKIDPAATPGPYLRRSVVNACYSWHRRNRRDLRMAGPPERDAGAGVEMWEALGHLSTRKRTVLVLRYYLDMPEAQVAATLGCRVGTVKSTTHRALADLRRSLER